MKCLWEVRDHPSFFFMLMNSCISKKDNPSYWINRNEFQTQGNGDVRACECERRGQWQKLEVGQWEVSDLSPFLECERQHSATILFLFHFLFLLMKKRFHKVTWRYWFAAFCLGTFQDEMGVCQWDSKCTAILSFLKLGFHTNSFYTRQIYLIENAFAPRQLLV
jgi:hypothetical protein